MNIQENLTRLRNQMKHSGVDAYLIPSTDPHHNEYVPSCFKRRVFVSGFTGSAGELLVLQDQALLWTDGRYFNQATSELKGSGVKLMKMGEPGVPTLEEFCSQNLPSPLKLGIDPQLLSSSRVESLKNSLAQPGQQLVFLPQNLVDLIWENRPSLPMDPVILLPTSLTGETFLSKIQRIRLAMKKKKAQALVLTNLDEIAWTLNARSQDVHCTPVVISYAILFTERMDWFVSSQKISPSVLSQLHPHVHIHPYEKFQEALQQISAQKMSVWLDGTKASYWVLSHLKNCEILNEPTPIPQMKAQKNATEIRGIQKAMIRDGVAWVRFLHWIEKNVPKKKVTELLASSQLEEYRKQGKNYQGPSFPTISAYGPHAAIIHYEPNETTNIPLRTQGLFLVDAGSQYLDGTTDMTRTLILGKKPSSFEKSRFTRVLKAHIRLAQARFPQGVRGMRLDTIARSAMWEAGLDYNHGTGHGIGFYLCVHEGPQSISPSRCNGSTLEAGNILSNEPGYYEDGKFGIRIENLVLVIKDKVFSTSKQTWYQFQTLSLCPIDKRLIEKKLLTQDEKAWINEYHQNVFTSLRSSLSPEDRRWLQKACSAM